MATAEVEKFVPIYADTVKPRRKIPKRAFSRESLLKILQSKFFSSDIARDAVDEYERVTVGQNYQDTRRNGLLYACVLRTYKNRGIPYDMRSVATQMGLADATMSQGIRLYCDNCEKLGERIIRLDPEPIEYVVLLIRQLTEVPDHWCNTGYRDKLTYTKEGAVDTEHIIKCIKSILDYLSGLEISSLTRNCTPRCCASSVIYFHLIACGCTIDKVAYGALVGCSPISIERVTQDISGHLKILRSKISS